MKKIISTIAIISTLSTPAMALSSRAGTTRPAPHPTTRPIVIHHHDNQAKNIAFAAIGIAVIATIVAVRASENCPGHVQIVRF